MIRPTIPDDVMELGKNTREEDEREVQSMIGLSAFDALTMGFFHSRDCITGTAPDGTVVLIAGVVPIPKGGSVWMLSAPEITQHRREIVRSGPVWIDEMAEKYGRLTNVVDARNTLHRRLIKHMGFEFGETYENYGKGKIPAVSFHKEPLNV